MGSHDRPGKEAKKKPKAKGASQAAAPLRTLRQQAELIRRTASLAHIERVRRELIERTAAVRWQPPSIR